MPTTPRPPTGALTDWLRAEAKQPFELPIGDIGDQIPLQWLQDELKDGERDATRLAFAVEQLLGEGDPLVSGRLISVCEGAAAPPLLRTALARAVGRHAKLLSGMGSATQSLLGQAVRCFVTDRFAEPLSHETLAVLHDIDQAKNGWPLSIAVGLRTTLLRFLDLTVPALARATDAQLKDFVFYLVGYDREDASDETLRRIGRDGDAALRARVAALVQANLAERKRAYEFLIGRGVAMPAVEPHDARWVRYAALLGVPA